MSTYNGQFQVQNSTGGTITHVLAQHYTLSSDALPSAVYYIDSLGNNDTGSSTGFTAKTGSNDRWSISFVNSGGVLITGYNGNASYHESDSEASNNNMVFSLNNEDCTMLFPVSGNDTLDYQQDLDF